uniref:Uncharacterized protein n=1 Tax=Anguilla anguilla TaxID=7936 RepID=A0A0E9Q868_ANGAN
MRKGQGRLGEDLRDLVGGISLRGSNLGRGTVGGQYGGGLMDLRGWISMWEGPANPRRVRGQALFDITLNTL